MTRQSWREWTFLCWTVIQFIAALSFRIELKLQYLYIFYKLNVKTSSRLLKPDSCQTHQHKTDRLTPDSRQTHTPPDPIAGVTIVSFAFLVTRVATVRTWFEFFPHRTNGALVQSSVTDIGYYIMSRLVLTILFTRIFKQILTVMKYSVNKEM
jgi:hypothetical protein